MADQEYSPVEFDGERTLKIKAQQGGWLGSAGAGEQSLRSLFGIAGPQAQQFLDEMLPRKDEG